MLRTCKTPIFLRAKSQLTPLPTRKSTRDRRHYYTTLTNASTSLRRQGDHNRTQTLPGLLTLTPTHATGWPRQRTKISLISTFGPREAGDGKMQQGATGRRQGGDRKATGWRQENNRKAAGKRQGSDRKQQAGDRKGTGEVQQRGNREATGRRQGGNEETTGKQQETRHSDRISDRKAKGRQQEGDRASGDRETTGKRQEKATGERQESDRRAAVCLFLTGRRQEGNRKATGMRHESDRLVEDDK